MEQERSLSANEVERMARQYEAGGVGSQSGGWSDANRGWSSGEVGRDQFPVLTAMSIFLRVIGWIAVAGGVLLAVFQVAPWFQCITSGTKPAQIGGFGAQSCGVAALILAPMLGSLAIGFCLIAFGEIIGVFRGIERNTNQLLSRVEQAGLRDKLAGGA